MQKGQQILELTSWKLWFTLSALGRLYVQSATRLHNHNSGLSNHFLRLRLRKLEPKCQLELEPDQRFNRNWDRNWRHPHSDSNSNSHAYPGTIVVHGSPHGYGE